MKFFKLTKSKIFVFSAIFFALGIFLASAFWVNQTVFFVAEACCVLVFALGFVGKKKQVMFLAGLLGFLFFGSIWLSFAVKPSEFVNFLNSEVQLQGQIVSEPDLRESKQLLNFLPKGFSQKILLTENLNTEYFYGDEVVVVGKLVEAKNSKEFDYSAFLRKENIYALINYPKILVLRSGQGNWFKTILFKVKYAFIKNLYKLFSKEDSNLILGILIGARKQLSQNTVENFTKTGLSHILSVSGFNISVILTSFAGFLAMFGRKWQFFIGIIFVSAFVVISGGSASVVRAAVMGSLMLLALVFGRPYKNATALCLAAGVMLFLNPLILFWDTGFALSFLATLGIVYGVNLLEKLTPNIAPWFGLKSLFLTSLCAIVLTIPLVANLFGNFSLVALPANLLVVPIVPFVMLFSFLTVLPFFGAGFALLTKILIDYMLWVVGWFSSLSYASLNLNISFLTSLFCYLGIFLIYVFLYNLQKNKVVEQKTDS